MIIRNQGFTLFELILTLTLAAILVSIAVPSFSATLARQRQHVEINALFHAIHLARKESIMRRKVVSICPSLDGENCDAARDWSTGWIVFENSDRDSPPRVDSGESVLLRHAVADGVQIQANRSGFTLRATFLRATNGTLIFCDQMRRITPKALVVSYTGRPRVAAHRTNRELYSCAD
jgi:type IV fimbrial biogenesis protein FimT